MGQDLGEQGVQGYEDKLWIGLEQVQDQLCQVNPSEIGRKGDRGCQCAVGVCQCLCMHMSTHRAVS